MRRIFVVLAALAWVVSSVSASSLKPRHPSLRALRHLDVVVLAGGPGMGPVEPLCHDLYGVVARALDGRGIEVGPYSKALWSDRAHLRVVAESRPIQGCTSSVRLRVLVEYVEEVFAGPSKVPLPALVSTWRWWDDVDVPEAAVEATTRSLIAKGSGFFAGDVSYAKETPKK